MKPEDFWPHAETFRKQKKESDAGEQPPGHAASHKTLL